MNRCASILALSLLFITARLQANAAIARESPGPSTRKTGLVISEVMYHPGGGSNDLEFVELYNSQAIPEDISGYRLTGAVDYLFPSNTIVSARNFLVLGLNPALLQSAYGLASIPGRYAGRLQNGSGTLRLRNRIGAVLLEMEYSGKFPWPAAPDGGGPSLVLARPSYGEANPAAWSSSVAVGGSPGGPEPTDNSPFRGLVINEILAHTDLPDLDYVELYNSGNQTVDLQGCILTDDATTNRFVFQNSSLLAPGAFRALTENELGFRLSAAGEHIFLFSPDRARVIDAVAFEAQENGISLGRWPDGAPEFYRSTAKTPGTRNAPILVSSVIINEIMYNPLSGSEDDEYLELYNRGTLATNIGGWRFESGIDFTFPTNTLIPADGYLVVAKNAARMWTNHSNLNAANTVGNYKGTLANRGERIALSMPDEIVTTNSAQQLVTNRIHIVVDEVTYAEGGRWGAWSDGGGSSLELRNPSSNKRLASNWADSDETIKAPWTSLSITGRLDNGDSSYGINNLQVLLQDRGECLVDNVEVIGPAGTNLVANWDFENGTAGWVARGTHEQSGLADEGFGGSAHSLYVRASGKGDTAANQIRVPLTTSLASGQIVTIRARVRWLSGRSEILFRIEGNFLELAAPLQTSSNLGTPGARNSRFVNDAGPAIYETVHFPVLPPANQPVLVTTKVHDPTPITSVILNYRIDPSNPLASITMRDDGTGGDALAGDGIYSANLPGQPSGTLIAFHVQAANAGGMIVKFPVTAPARECLVRFGDATPAGGFGAYRLWMTQSNINRWTSRVKLSNALLDGTFIYGNERVIYSAGAIYSGSPYHSPSYSGPLGSPCDYTFVLPEDDRFLGETDVHLSWPGNGGDDSTAQREQAAYWVVSQLGLPFHYRRFVHLYINGTHRATIMEDTQRANSEVIQQWFPDDANGDLFKIAGWFEFDDAVSSFHTTWATLQNFTTTDALTGERYKKTARYRWNWQKRVIQDSAHDFTNLFSLVDAVNVTGPSYTSAVDELVDVDQWMRTFAAEHLFGNWDSYGNRNGQNMYAYKPERGRWQLLIWDLDIALGGSSDAATSSLFQVSDTLIGRMYNHPPFRRLYWAALKEAVNGPLLATRFNPMVDAKFAAFQSNSVAVTSPSGIKSYISSRRSSVLAQLAAVNFPFAITSNGGLDFTVTNNLVILSGTAPVETRTLSVNGVSFTPSWTTISNWVISLPLSQATNTLSVQGIDRLGKAVAGASDVISITFAGKIAAPRDFLRINEIMYHPVGANASYIEIFNGSPDFTFDLSHYRLEGADFNFADGTLLPPLSFALVVEDAIAFEAAYGPGLPIVGEFKGSLDNGGELIQLVREDNNGMREAVNEVRYDDDLPWPIAADGTGPSLQLMDWRQDNRRVANWMAVTNGIGYTPGRSNSVPAALPDFPALWVNEVQPVNVGDARDRFGDPDPWLELYNAGSQIIDLGGFTLSDNFTNLAKWTFPTNSTVNPGEFRVVWVDGEPGETAGNEWHTSFRMARTNASLVLSRNLSGQSQILDYLSFDQVSAGRSYGSFPDGNPLERDIFHFPTPGRTNNNALLATILINEWMASNTGRLADPANGPALAYDDWIELYNAGSVSADLSGYTMTDNLAQPRKFVIPRGTLIAPKGFLLVWADSETNQNGFNSDLHAGFKLSQGGEEIGLFDPDGRVIDQLKFDNQFDNVSQGRWRDGQNNGFLFMTNSTPRSSNIYPVVNSVPLLELTDQILDEMVSWTFSAAAFDPDVPPQRLAYSLRPGSPADLTLNPTNGLLRWTPTETHGGTAYPITIDVTDDGIPSMAVSISISLAVNEVNAAPRLANLSDISVNGALPISFDASAIDSDLPLQGLAFALDPGAPAAAVIDPVTGHFSWTPAPEDVPGSYAVTVRVSDDGAPSLSDAQTVMLHVVGPPRVVNVTVSASDATLQIATLAGKTYRVDYTDVLSPPNWIPLGPPFAGTGSLIYVTDVAINGPQRFYQVVQLD